MTTLYNTLYVTFSVVLTDPVMMGTDPLMMGTDPMMATDPMLVTDPMLMSEIPMGKDISQSIHLC